MVGAVLVVKALRLYPYSLAASLSECLKVSNHTFVPRLPPECKYVYMGKAWHLFYVSMM